MKTASFAAVLLLMFAAAPAPAQRVDAETASQFGPLIDSLVALIGAKPAEVRRGVGGGLRDGSLRPTPDGWVVTLATSMSHDRRFAVLHEFGHFLNAVHGEVFYAYLDSLNLNEAFTRHDREVWEQFADDFAWAWMGHENGWGDSFRPGANLLRRQLWPVVATASAAGR